MSASINFSHLSLNQNDRNNEFSEGVATVWLLSTLGSSTNRGTNARNNASSLNSNTSSVKKKDIINVSIPDTCMVIQNNEMQLPLRYVSNLLYGVTVCYNRKTEYVLNDLTALLIQLQRRIYTGQSTTGQKKYSKNEQRIMNTTILTSNENDSNNGLLSDDPLFDISQVADFEQMLGMAPKENMSEAATIRKQDYLRELTNSNVFERQAYLKGSDSLDHLNRSITLDDIPIDVDFNLEIDDVMSQQGTVRSSNTGANTPNDHSNDLNLNFENQEFTLNFEDEESDVNQSIVGGEHTAQPNAPLGLPEQEEDNQDESFVDEHDEDGPTQKKFKKGDIFNGAANAPQLIQFDERTGLSTEVLKNNHNNYCRIMESRRKPGEHRSSLKTWKQIMDLDKQPQFVQNSWNFVLNPNDGISLRSLNGNDGFESSSFERGRKRSGSNSNSEKSSSNVPSEEMGRRMMVSREDSVDFNASDNLLLNLDQINEELQENSSRDTSAHPHDFMQMNLDLPPSSFGRTYTRAGSGTETFGSTSSANGENDAIDILYQRTKGTANKRGYHKGTSNSFGSHELSEIPSHDEHEFAHPPFQIVLDYQARKFYEYIKERALFVGKTTRSNPPFRKKLLLEDIVPSQLSSDRSDDTDGDQNESNKDRPIINKRIAANAFLSLLNLASKELIDIREYQDQNAEDGHSKVMKGDDIVIYA